MRGEEHLERGGVQRCNVAGHVGQRLVGDQHEALAASPKSMSRSTRTTRPGWRLASPTARLEATTVLPDPPFGDSTVMSRLWESRGRLTPCEVGPQTGAGLQRPVEGLEQLLGDRVRCDHVAGARPEGVLPHLGAGGRHDEHGDLGPESLQLASHVEGDLEREVGAQRDHFGIGGGDLLDRRRRILDPAWLNQRRRSPFSLPPKALRTLASNSELWVAMVMPLTAAPHPGSAPPASGGSRGWARLRRRR